MKASAIFIVVCAEKIDKRSMVEVIIHKYKVMIGMQRRSTRLGESTASLKKRFEQQDQLGVNS